MTIVPEVDRIEEGPFDLTVVLNFPCCSAVFGVRDSLVLAFEPDGDGLKATFDITLTPKR